MEHGRASAEVPWAAREVRVLAVDDQAPFREVLREVVDAASGFVLVGEASSGDEAVQAADALAPDVVLMDVRLPGMDGVSATREIIHRHPGMVMVLVSVDDPALEPGVRSLGEAVSHVCKQDLRPQTLREVWESAGDNRQRRMREQATSTPGHQPSGPGARRA